MGTATIGFTVGCGAGPGSEGIDTPLLSYFCISMRLEEWERTENLCIPLIGKIGSNEDTEPGDDTDDIAARLASVLHTMVSEGGLPGDAGSAITIEDDGGEPGHIQGRVVIRDCTHVDATWGVSKVRVRIVAEGGCHVEKPPNLKKTAEDAEDVWFSIPQKVLDEFERKRNAKKKIKKKKVKKSGDRTRDPDSYYFEEWERKRIYHEGLLGVQAPPAVGSFLLAERSRTPAFPGDELRVVASIPFLYVRESPQAQIDEIASRLRAAGVEYSLDDGGVTPISMNSGAVALVGCGIETASDPLGVYGGFPWKVIIESGESPTPAAWHERARDSRDRSVGAEPGGLPDFLRALSEIRADDAARRLPD